MTYLSDHYEELGIEYDFRKRALLDKLNKYLVGKTFLEIGTGRGDLMFLAKSKRMDVTGLEPDGKLIALSYRLYGKMNIINQRFEDYQSDTRYDCVAAVDFLEHVEDDKAAISRIHSLLAPGGRLVLVVPSPPYLYGKRDKNVGHCRRYSLQNIQELVEQAGFKIIHSQYWNMLGLPAYWFYEKILHKDLNVYSIRTKPSLTNRLFQQWFKLIENKINLGFGLGIICIAEAENGL